MPKLKKPAPKPNKGFDPTRKPALSEDVFGSGDTKLKVMEAGPSTSQIGKWKGPTNEQIEAAEAKKSGYKSFDFSKDIEAITGKKFKKKGK
jgi:hypothetical protein